MPQNLGHLEMLLFQSNQISSPPICAAKAAFPFATFEKVA